MNSFVTEQLITLNLLGLPHLVSSSPWFLQKSIFGAFASKLTKMRLLASSCPSVCLTARKDLQLLKHFPEISNWDVAQKFVHTLQVKIRQK
jgi:hypothetical protein